MYLTYMKTAVLFSQNPKIKKENMLQVMLTKSSNIPSLLLKQSSKKEGFLFA